MTPFPFLPFCAFATTVCLLIPFRTLYRMSVGHEATADGAFGFYLIVVTLSASSHLISSALTKRLIRRVALSVRRQLIAASSLACLWVCSVLLDTGAAWLRCALIALAATCVVHGLATALSPTVDRMSHEPVPVRELFVGRKPRLFLSTLSLVVICSALITRYPAAMHHYLSDPAPLMQAVKNVIRASLR